MGWAPLAGQALKQILAQLQEKLDQKNTTNANASVSELVCFDRDPENCQGIDVFKYRIGVVPRQRLNMAMKALGLS
jgi:hypothetical protein